jgi:hypothetical protein
LNRLITEIKGMNNLESTIEDFFKAYWSPGMKIVSMDSQPKEMLVGPVDQDGWIEWKLIKGNLTVEDYRGVERQFNVHFPESFISWHKSYFFLDCDCSFIRLPISSPVTPLLEIRENLDWNRELIKQGLIPFGREGNDTGPLVFDARKKVNLNEYPIRVYDLYAEDSNGLSAVIFSSFTKLLQCATHFMRMSDSKKNFEIIPDFFLIDSEGAGSKEGRLYWKSWTEMMKANYEEFG